MKNIQFIILLGVCCLLIGGLFVFLYFYKNPIDKDLWCARNRPQYNVSFNPRVSYCFNEGWEKYCKVSYPQFCPKDASIINHSDFNNTDFFNDYPISFIGQNYTPYDKVMYRVVFSSNSSDEILSVEEENFTMIRINLDYYKEVSCKVESRQRCFERTK